ncbi:OLC1v1000754C1 [Oldenlandia corymbosa var. corymbosa]|uniref:OLC1v1000754C1 n=1 Tax=Oldenlandia corymbosa var. corymbosa TaxID=529605 RepID=A0AAV1D659_OLDCO|nr:OLC1v1000754C1 [Oldenlandia corymbosa var. corymbosa]
MSSSSHLSNEALEGYESTSDPESGTYNITISSENVTMQKSSRGLYRGLFPKAETLGCFMVVFSTCASLACMEYMGIKGGIMENAATAALSIAIIIFAFGEISRAHLNPAISISFAIVGPFPWVLVTMYVLAQLGGCVLGSLAGRLVYDTKLDALLTKPTQGLGAAFSVEFVATSLVMFLAATLSTNKPSAGRFSGFVMGLAVGLGVILSGHLSGGSMNPARSLGPAIVACNFDHMWIYVVAPTFGAIFGGLLQRALRLQGWTNNDILPNDQHVMPLDLSVGITNYRG